ncbi:DNA-directed RNA polymerase subunit beta [Hondaea fermentalgiana]|uniref:DNA-directed RNA polymerase subunit beta n=1 Tax=Hondaea fermentalgiana TaxID=2315210 RepID=A0A2R5G8X5_9STRA|nr:DNA-directed RNA polymerase subunit beta [Hondaea fermentalgiana]|eukprot:GBG27516.1 DNA-directed RNA polymerase subunit beta [Hondaea fermentalgiana]
MAPESLEIEEEKGADVGQVGERLLPGPADIPQQKPSSGLTPRERAAVDEAPARNKWKLLPEFLKVRGLVKQHIDSYNHFVEVEMKKIVASKMNREIRSDNNHHFFLRYEDVYVGTPEVDQNLITYKVTPQECRLRDLTYAAPIYVDVCFTRGRGVFRKRKLQIGRIPVMLQSSRCRLRGKSVAELEKLKECPYDPGGYFVVKGSEKVILIQEQLSKNRIIIEQDSKKQTCASVTSSTHERKSRTAVYIKNNRIYLKHNSISADIPIFIVLKAMDCESELLINYAISGTSGIRQFLIASAEEAARAGIFTRDQALEFIGQYIKHSRAAKRSADDPTNTAPLRADEAKDVLALMVLGHVPVNNYDFRDKAFYLMYMVRQCCQAEADPSLLDDKDYYGNKRLELAGQLLALLFEDLFKRFNTELKLQAERVLSKANQADAFDIMKHMSQNIITNGFVQAISTGNWSLKRFKMERAGVTQQLSRLSFMSAIGHMTRITSQFEKTRKVSGPRALQPSQWGMLCPSDTPEGESCGLVKNLALLTHVTSDEEDGPVRQLVLRLGVEDIKLLGGEEIFSEGAYVVMLNGEILGLTAEPEVLAEQLRKLRRAGRLGEYVSVFVNRDKATVQIATDGGRMCRPLIVVDKATHRGKVRNKHLRMLREGKMAFHQLLEQGLIEYVDVNESNNTMVALSDVEGESAGGATMQEATHLEIDPLTILGIVVGLVPFPHHNQSPRNTYQCAMGKQAVGTIGMNQLERIDTLLYLMCYPHKPLVHSRTLELVNFDCVPAGQNAIVAVMSYSGYDIEDAIIINKSSMERGFARCMVMRKYATQLKTYANNTMDRLAPPPFATPDAPPAAAGKFCGVGYDGVIEIGSRVEKNGVLVNREMPTNTSDLMVTGPGMGHGSGEFKPSALCYKGPGDARVDKVMISSSEFESHIIKVVTREVRMIELGDKFSSRHGQKGVVGLIVPQVDMPFTDQGIVPDIIMNPHGFPSRMTVGKLMELICSKAGAVSGVRQYGTAFAENPVKACSETLVKHGHSYHGKEVVTDGITGETVEAHIFFGPVYYQRLKHMVADKMHARARGPRAVLTRQPTEGRSRDGGLRLGEMERDCLIGYGASGLLIERLMISSDIFEANVCLKCGFMANPVRCQNCRTGAHLTSLSLPYACKLLFQELHSMNIIPKLTLQDL